MPETVIGWHRQGFRWYWAWKVRHGKAGRRPVPKQIRDLIRTMSRENPIWGAPRIHSELMKLDIKISEASIAKYMIRSPKPPSQMWRTFLKNHVSQLASVDFFTFHTVWFQVLFIFIVLTHDRRRVVHFNVTAHPTAEWTAQQMREAFPFDTAPRYLLRDRDRIYGQEFRNQVAVMNIKEVLSARGLRHARPMCSGACPTKLGPFSLVVPKIIQGPIPGGVFQRVDRRVVKDDLDQHRN